MAASLPDRAQQALGKATIDRWAWAGERRQQLGYDQAAIAAGIRQEGRRFAREGLSAWAGATRARSAVENGSSLVRPHGAAPHAFGVGFTALLAVGDQQRVVARGRMPGSARGKGGR
jgi:hypothetical protein